MSVIPDAPREGIVINLPSMRLLYATREATDAGSDSPLRVSSNPIGIGREGWSTPIGTTKVTQKVVDPAWYPPASIRAEHVELGDPLPSIVPAGPDNPLGRHMLKLGLPGYLIHGTNKPAGVGMRVSHGCIRMYPEDIETLFERVPRTTPVTIVNQPALAGWRDGELYLEVHPPLAEDERELAGEARRVIAAALARAGRERARIDNAVVARVVAERRGIPFPILAQNLELDAYLARSRIVQNADVATVTASR
jgi:L,D-transpeptidase ErfK/SrfK